MCIRDRIETGLDSNIEVHEGCDSEERSHGVQLSDRKTVKVNTHNVAVKDEAIDVAVHYGDVEDLYADHK